MGDTPPTDLRKTPLFDRHVALGGRMVDFAGYALPVQYAGIVAEHRHTREAASLFDVSHMGQLVFSGPDHATTVGWLEKVVPADLASLAPGEMRYTVLLNDKGGIEDDLIVTRPAEGYAEDGVMFAVVNGARKAHDLRYLQRVFEGELRAEMRPDLALIALQGPKAAGVLADLTDATDDLGFMQSAPATLGGIETYLSRSGYTGEDGFEISLENADAVALFDLLIAHPAVEPAGLGARDSLRLEAGLCLYGHDMTEETDPVSASLLFSMGRERRKTGGFAGFEAIGKALSEGPATRRVGIRFQGRQPVREGAELLDESGQTVGHVTSGGFAPTLEAPIAMGYVRADLASPGQAISAAVRGKIIPGQVVRTPFVPNTYVRKTSK
ncbi:glycine cleavage system aminomethyltransferase GcvT [Pelagibacterium montanilacus]|uniref:glycine cleavage system aminomethyltransferase GcvT n=1 Tax=Pelagibacterium montanilacus TaxID=2185280 RepID=UPI000F8DE0FC|nr:glycine cleavage system aminomethyltransferase GcvT [Pelagibacterium montanilacus]